MIKFSAGRLVRCVGPLALALPLAGPASADFLLWSASPGDWDLDANWVQLFGTNHEPDANDTASISGSVDVTQAGEVAELVRLFGSGEMNILGGNLTTTNAQIAYLDNADNTVTVSGASSNWDITQTLRVGMVDTGELRVENSGQVTSATGIIGDQAGSIGTATVTGAGSAWDNTGDLFVGNAGTGTLNIGTDGQVTVGATTRVSALGTLNINGGTLNAEGGLMLNGGSLTQTAGVLVLGAGQTVNANNGAQIDFMGNYNVGGGTTFALSGGADFMVSSYLDVGSGSDGTLTLDGAGSTLTTNTTNTTYLDWGFNGGNGAVTLSNQAQATINATEIRFAGDTVAGSQGALTIQSGATMTANSIALASAAGGAGTGTISIDGAGSSLTLNGASTLTVGNATINLTNDGTLNTGTGLTTFNANANINAAGGSFNVNGDLLIDGAAVTIDGLFSLADSATAFTAANDAQVSFAQPWSIDGGSTYRVEGGADLVMRDLLIIGAAANPGFSDLGDGTLIIDGAWSSFDYGNLFTADPLFIGDTAGVSGTLTVQNGATATIGADFIFLTLNTGAASSGTLNVLSGATMTTNDVHVAASGDGDAAVNIDGAGSMLALNGSSELLIGGGGGTATVNLTNGGALSAQNITRRSNSAFNFTGGTLAVNTFDGDLLNQGGTLATGDTTVEPFFIEIGTTTINGDYTQQAGGTLAVELTSIFRGGGSGSSDLLDVSGELGLAGTLEITIDGGFPLVPGVRADILDWDTITGAFDSVVINDEFGDLELSGVGLNLQDLYTTGELGFDLLGDANTDGFVGVADLDILLAHWGDSVNLYDYAAGDLTGDGLVGDADLQLVLANFGNGTPGGGNVPEPGTLALLGFALLGVSRRRRCV